ncbi:MAG: hypothetical protein PHX74_12200 [Candidatus Sumerlaeales bacterium]|nr:hypothetical protein [Candidatus Sumerlaeales bacterium]
MKTSALLAALSLVSVPCLAQTEATSPLSMAVPSATESAIAQPTNPASTEIKWSYDLLIAEDQAMKTGQLVLVYFETDTNAKCKTLEQNVFSNPLVIAEMQKLVPIKADFLTNTKLAYSLWLYGAGTFAILDANGTVLVRADVDEAIDSVDEFLAFIKKGEEAKATHKVAVDKLAEQDTLTTKVPTFISEAVTSTTPAATPVTPATESLTTQTAETSAPAAL